MVGFRFHRQGVPEFAGLVTLDDRLGRFGRVGDDDLDPPSSIVGRFDDPLERLKVRVVVLAVTCVHPPPPPNGPAAPDPAA